MSATQFYILLTMELKYRGRVLLIIPRGILKIATCRIQIDQDVLNPTWNHLSATQSVEPDST